MANTSIMRDGEIVEVDVETVTPPVSAKEMLLRNAGSNILTAPKQGFSGPSGKELFNGNR